MGRRGDAPAAPLPRSLPPHNSNAWAETLQVLDLSRCSRMDRCVVFLNHLTNLKSLNLSNTTA